jgi:two-component system C4-dicarboxylate transport response regulator DctD
MSDPARTEQSILLVDDDDVLRGALEQSFELAGISVIAERDPVAALARIDAGFDGAVVSACPRWTGSSCSAGSPRSTTRSPSC